MPGRLPKGFERDGDGQISQDAQVVHEQLCSCVEVSQRTEVHLEIFGALSVKVVEPRDVWEARVIHHAGRPINAGGPQRQILACEVPSGWSGLGLQGWA